MTYEENEIVRLRPFMDRTGQELVEVLRDRETVDLALARSVANAIDSQNVVRDETGVDIAEAIRGLHLVTDTLSPEEILALFEEEGASFSFSIDTITNEEIEALFDGDSEWDGPAAGSVPITKEEIEALFDGEPGWDRPDFDTPITKEEIDALFDQGKDGQG